MKRGKYKGKALLASLGAIGVLCQSSSAEAADVLHDVQGEFDRLRSAAQEVEDHRAAVADLHQTEQDLRTAEDYVRSADEEVAAAEDEHKNTQAALADARMRASDARERVRVTEETVAVRAAETEERRAAAERYTHVLAAAQAEYDAAEAAAEAAQAAAEAASAAAAGISGGDETIKLLISSDEMRRRVAEAARQAGYDYPLMEQLERGLYTLPAQEPAPAAAPAVSPAATAASDAAEVQASAAQVALDRAAAKLAYAEQRAEELGAALEAAEDAEEEARGNYADAVEEVRDADEEVSQAYKDLTAAVLYVGEARAARTESEADLALAERDHASAVRQLARWGAGRGAEAGIEYYAWHGGEGGVGHQRYHPVSYSYSDGRLEFGVGGGYVVSRTGKENGHVSGFTDTTVDLGLWNKHDRYDVRYGLSVNLPTGMAQIHDAAVVPSNVAALTRFGEGWNWTPNITVREKIDETDSWYYRFAYAIRGKYDYTMDAGTRDPPKPNATLNPGDRYEAEVRYLHAAKNERLTAFLRSSLFTGRTQEGNQVYREGATGTLGAFYTKRYTKKDTFKAYVMLELDGAASYRTVRQTFPEGAVGDDIKHTIEAPPHSDNTFTRYYGIGLTREISKTQRLRVMLHHSRSKGTYISTRDNTSSEDQMRTSVQVGYDLRLTNREALTINAERYFYRASPRERYHGWGVTLMLSRSF